MVAAAVKLLRSDGLAKSKVVPLGTLQSSFLALYKRVGKSLPSRYFVDLVDRLRADGFINVGPHKDTAKQPVTLVAAAGDIEDVLKGLPFWS